MLLFLQENSKEFRGNIAHSLQNTLTSVTIRSFSSLMLITMPRKMTNSQSTCAGLYHLRYDM